MNGETDYQDNSETTNLFWRLLSRGGGKGFLSMLPNVIERHHSLRRSFIRSLPATISPLEDSLSAPPSASQVSLHAHAHLLRLSACAHSQQPGNASLCQRMNLRRPDPPPVHTQNQNGLEIDFPTVVAAPSRDSELQRFKRFGPLASWS